LSIQHYGVGDIAECPHCGREFELMNLEEEELDDFDEYFEHITTCDG
jgi:hypothetical protein